MVVDTLEFTKETLEELCDGVKVVLLKQLTREKLIKEDIADRWCASHSIVLRKKRLFRTISELFRKEKDFEKGYYPLVVKADVFEEEEKKDGKKEG